MLLFVVWTLSAVSVMFGLVGGAMFVAVVSVFRIKPCHTAIAPLVTVVIDGAVMLTELAFP